MVTPGHSQDESLDFCLETPHLENCPLFRILLKGAWIRRVDLDHRTWLVKFLIFKVNHTSYICCRRRSSSIQPEDKLGVIWCLIPDSHWPSPRWPLRFPGTQAPITSYGLLGTVQSMEKLLVSSTEIMPSIWQHTVRKKQGCLLIIVAFIYLLRELCMFPWVSLSCIVIFMINSKLFLWHRAVGQNENSKNCLSDLKLHMGTKRALDGANNDVLLQMTGIWFHWCEGYLIYDAGHKEQGVCLVVTPSPGVHPVLNKMQE